MEHCKFCQAELEEGSSICPGCGKDNAESVQEPAEETLPDSGPEQEDLRDDSAREAAEPVSAAETEEEVAPGEEPEEALSAPIEPGMKLTPGKAAALVAGLIVLLAVLAALVLWGMKNRKTE